MHDIEAILSHDLTFNFETVSNATLIRLSANEAHNSSSNFRVSEIEAYNTTLTADDYTGSVKDAEYNIPEMVSDNLIAGKTATVTSGRISANLSCLTNNKYSYTSDQAHVLYGAYNQNTTDANGAYYQFDFGEATRMNLVKLYLSTQETYMRPRDIVVDTKLTDDSWKRVAANYNISYSTAPTDRITVSSGGTVQNSRLKFTFETVECIDFRVTSNRQRTRVINNETARAI